MIKKAIKVAAALTVGAGVLFGTDAFSYARTGLNEAKAAVKAEVPLEFQIERAKDLVKDLVPEVRKSLHVIAEEQVAIERLEETIAKREANLTEKEAAIRTLRNDLKTDHAHFVYAGRQFDRGEVSKDLAVRFERFTTAKETLDRDRSVLDAKRRALSSHRQQLEGMLEARKDLELKIENLQARLRSVEAAETVSQVTIDDSGLSKAKELIEELNSELDVRERMLEEAGTSLTTGEIPVEVDAASEIPVDLVERIDAYLGDTAIAEEVDIVREAA